MSAVGANDGLVSAMERMTTAPSAEARRELHLALARSKVLVPLAEPAGDDDAPTLFVAVENEGRSTLLGFTDEGALQTWARGDWPWVDLDGPTICRIVAEHDADGLVLNPSGPWGGRLSREDAELVAERLLPEQNDDGGVLSARGGARSSLNLLALREEPAPELVEAIRAGADDAGACACYLAEGALGAGTLHLVAGLVLERDASAAEAARRIAGRARSVLGADSSLDVVALDGELLESMRLIGRVLFERERRDG
jgi:hypothetical protein